ncbi:MFS transporter [Streptomyces sp. NPDC055078]
MSLPGTGVPVCPTAIRRQVGALERGLLFHMGLDDLILLYPVYALLFAEHSLSTADISSLFVIWSVTGLLVEVPSGVVADVVSRRLVMVIGPLLQAVGFALWVALPSYGVFALGFVLWGTGGSLRSGATEALVYEELDRLGAAARYPALMGRAAAAGTAATALATAAAGPVFAWGGYRALGIASVVACVLCAVAAARLPEHRARRGRGSGQETREAEGAATLRAGLAEVRGSGAVRRALLPAVLLTTVWGALDEYVPLLAAETGATTRNIPFLVLAVWVGVTAGGLLASRAERLGPRATGALLASAGLAMAAGALSGGPAGFLLLAPAFLVFQLADVVADARLQAAITGPSRATVTSFAGFGTSVSTLLVYGAYGAASGRLDHGPLFALFALPYLGVALTMALSRPGRPEKVGPEDR